MQISNLFNLVSGTADQASSSAKVATVGVNPAEIPESPAMTSEKPQDTGNFQEVLTREVSSKEDSDPAETEKIQKSSDSEKDESDEKSDDNTHVDPASLSLISATQCITALVSDAGTAVEDVQSEETGKQGQSTQQMTPVSAAQANTSPAEIAASTQALPADEGVSEASTVSAPSEKGAEDVYAQKTSVPKVSDTNDKAVEIQDPQKTRPEAGSANASSGVVTDTETVSTKVDVTTPKETPSANSKEPAVSPVASRTEDSASVGLADNGQKHVVEKSTADQVNVGVQNQSLKKDTLSEQPRAAKSELSDISTAKTDHTTIAPVQQNVTAAEAQLQTQDMNSAAALDASETKRVIADIVSKIHTTIGERIHETQIDLKPDFLGKMNIRLTVEGDRVSMRLQVANAAVRELVESNFSSLRDSLRERGFTMDSVHVSVNAGGQDYQHTQQQGMTQQSSPVASSSGIVREEERPDAFSVSGIREEFAFADSESINYLI